jgi:hypothetical protein
VFVRDVGLKSLTVSGHYFLGTKVMKEPLMLCNEILSPHMELFIELNEIILNDVPTMFEKHSIKT